jgi:chromosomal replication initiator protein
LVSGVFSLPLIDPVAGPREFLAGEENALVRIARRVVLEQDRPYLPLVICGATGAGKTFLAEGLAECWRQAAAGREVLRLSGVDFARAYADAVDTDSLEDFRQGLSRPGLILLDAVHTVVEKPRAARELCHQLDGWLAVGKVIVCTSLVSPVELGNAGLASRLSGGLVVSLALPEADTRRHLLAHFARERSLAFEPELLDRLAERVRGAISPVPSPRDLQGALLQLESTARLTGCEVDAGLLESMFQSTESPQPIDFKQILATVAKRFGVTLTELRSSSRRQSLVRARGVAILLARRLTKESLQALGQLLGKRDHSTIHHALESTEHAVKADATLQVLVGELETELIAQTTTADSKRRRSHHRKARRRG